MIWEKHCILKEIQFFSILRVQSCTVLTDDVFSNTKQSFRWNWGWWRSQVYLSRFGWCWISDLIVLPPDCWIITSFPQCHAHWNREVQITEFVKQWIPVQLHSEADVWKDGKIRPHIRRPYPAGARYSRIWKFGRISAGARARYDIRCNPSDQTQEATTVWTHNYAGCEIIVSWSW